MKTEKFLVIHAYLDWTFPEARKELYDFEAIVGDEVELIPNLQHPGGVILKDLDALKKAIRNGETRYEEIQIFKTEPPQTVPCRWVIIPSPPVEKQKPMLSSAFGKKAHNIGKVGAFFVFAIFISGIFFLWKSDFAKWIQITGTIAAIVLMFIGIFYVF